MFDVIIIGGSYAGLSAAMALGRALKKVLIIDGGEPCNRFTPHSHNFLTQDGKEPAEIANIARSQVKQYESVAFYEGLAVHAQMTDNIFKVITRAGDEFHASKLIFATGIRDIMPAIPGLEACWGKSVIHCPYCHGYEVRNERTGILGNGDYAFEFASLISNWTDKLSVYTNGNSTLSQEQVQKLHAHGINIIEDEIEKLDHINGELQKIIFKNGKTAELKALYTRLPFTQHCTIPETLGCELTPDGYIQTDTTQKTTVNGVYACGDNTTRIRTVSNAVFMGTTAGITVSKELINEKFK